MPLTIILCSLMEPWNFLEAQFDRHGHTKAPANRQKKKKKKIGIQCRSAAHLQQRARMYKV